VEYLAVALVSLAAAFLTLFSGFGLGTILLPVFALFFPMAMAVAMTAVVHLLNNLFKLVLVGRYTDRAVALRFGLPAVVASFAGAWLLLVLSGLPDIAQYHAFGRTLVVTPVRLTVSLLMVGFALFDILPGARRIAFGRRWLPVGGALSGFFGGLSGHQGALRSAFLVRLGLDAQAFVATGVVIACVVDIVRIGVYGSRYDFGPVAGEWRLVAAAVAAAFVGAFAGARLLGKVSIQSIRYIVAVMLIGLALGLGSGLL
jgi:uncharacterized membrane protein YfcA